MGTNYYLVKPAERCEHCGSVSNREESIHIGKSAVGWHFGFEITEVKTIDAWKKKIDEWTAQGGWIATQYDSEWSTKVSLDSFWELVTKKRDSPECMAKHSSNFHKVVCCDGVDLCDYSFS